jgi:hypothetical protein
MQKTGQVERTVDREFVDEEAKFKGWVAVAIRSLLRSHSRSGRFEKEANLLQKDSKAFIDALRGQ